MFAKSNCANHKVASESFRLDSGEIMNLKLANLALGASMGLISFVGIAQAEDKFDIAIETALASDGMRYGYTYTNHLPAVSISITPSYGIYYGSLYAERVNYGAADPRWAEVKGAIGMTPVFGPLSIDFNLQRRDKPGSVNGASARWLPYVTATYAFNDNFSTSLGAGYYAYDDASLTKSYWELFAAVDATPVAGLKLHGEASYDPQSNFSAVGVNSDYLELIASATVSLPKNFEIYGKIGYENYINQSLLPYTWYEAGINYNLNDHVTIGLKGHANNMDQVTCAGGQAWTDCSNAVFATLTLRGKASDLAAK